MPNTSAGIQAPASALLLAEPLSTMPSTWPVPNFSGSFENFLLIAYDIHAAMSAPAPGSAPISVPSTLPRRICFGYLTASAPHALEDVADRLVDDQRLAARCRPRSG